MNKFPWNAKNIHLLRRCEGAPDEIMKGPKIPRAESKFKGDETIVFNQSLSGFKRFNGPFTPITSVIPSEMSFRNFTEEVLCHNIDVDEIESFSKFMSKSDAANHKKKATDSVILCKFGPDHKSKDDKPDPDTEAEKKAEKELRDKLKNDRKKLLSVYKQEGTSSELNEKIANWMMKHGIANYPAMQKREFDSKYESLKDDAELKAILSSISDKTPTAKVQEKSTHDVTEITTKNSFDSSSGVIQTAAATFGVAPTFHAATPTVPGTATKKRKIQELEKQKDKFDAAEYEKEKKIRPASPNSEDDDDDENQDTEMVGDGTEKPKEGEASNDNKLEDKTKKPNKTDSIESITSAYEALKTRKTDMSNMKLAGEEVLKHLGKDAFSKFHKAHLQKLFDEDQAKKTAS